MKFKMKKLLAIVLAISMIACLAVFFTACGAKENKEFKVGLICLHDDSSTYDANFINAFNDSIEKLNKEGYKITKIVKTNIDENNDCYEAAADLVDQGCKVVFADSFGHEPYMIKAAKEFKDVTFCHATGTNAHTENLDNFVNAFASIYEGRYLAGVAAGMKLAAMKAADNTVSSKIGYVGAFPYAEVVSGYTSFYLGVKSIVSDVTMEVKYTNSWYLPTAEQEAADTLISRGAVLISQHADSMGAPNACESKNVPNVTYNISTKKNAPNTYIIASRINWSPYYEYVIKAVAKGEKIDKDYVGTLATGSVETLELGTAAAAGTEAKLAEVKAKIENGTLKIFDTNNFTVDGEKVTTYKADVDSDEEYTGDTEVIINGVFEESKFRSAPYFDLRIDGITELK